MDKLKNFIESNREAFDDETLPEGHLERFEQKLPPRRKNRLKLYGICLFAAAASIALLFLLQLPGGAPMPETPLRTATQGCETKEEIEELRLYYNMQMKDVLTQIENIYKKEQTTGAAELLRETKRVLTDSYQFEETILPTLPCSSNGLFAMTQHYNNSLESLSFMLKQMEQVAGANDKQLQNN